MRVSIQIDAAPTGALFPEAYVGRSSYQRRRRVRARARYKERRAWQRERPVKELGIERRAQVLMSVEDTNAAHALASVRVHS
jgi:hypothetical protein